MADVHVQISGLPRVFGLFRNVYRGPVRRTGPRQLRCLMVGSYGRQRTLKRWILSTYEVVSGSCGRGAQGLHDSLRRYVSTTYAGALSRYNRSAVKFS